MSQDYDSTDEGSGGDYSLDEEDQLSAEDTLDGRGLDDPLDEGYSPPEQPMGVNRYGVTDYEQRTPRGLDSRLREELPDEELSEDFEDPLEVSPAADGERLDTRRNHRRPNFSTEDRDEDYDEREDDSFVDDYEVGQTRARRLVDDNEGFGPDTTKDLVGTDVGISGAGASAEEAAVHVVSDDDEEEAEAGDYPDADD